MNTFFARFTTRSTRGKTTQLDATSIRSRLVWFGCLYNTIMSIVFTRFWPKTIRASSTMYARYSKHIRLLSIASTAGEQRFIRGISSASVRKRNDVSRPVEFLHSAPRCSEAESSQRVRWLCELLAENRPRYEKHHVGSDGKGRRRIIENGRT